MKVFLRKLILKIFSSKNDEALSARQFMCCSNLQNVTFDKESKIFIIPPKCFYAAFEIGTSKMPKIILPEKVTRVGEEAFSLSGIIEVIFGEDLEYIDSYAFADSSIHIANFKKSINVEKIHVRAFSRCFNLTQIDMDQINLSDFTGEIKEFAFADSNLTEVILGDCIRSINDSSFNNTPVERANNLKFPLFVSKIDNPRAID